MSRWLSPVTGALGGAVDALFPDLIERSLAEDDGAWSADEADAYCARCGASAGPGAVTPRGCAFCVNQSLAWDRLTRLGAYEPPLDDRIRRMKFGRQWRWGHWLGDRLAEVLVEPFDATRLIVCPVPMHWTRRWMRGFNQSGLIAQRIAHRRGWTPLPLLRRTRLTRPQPTVVPSMRRQNVRGSVALAEEMDLRNAEVLLVDDVKTSGATVGLCARVLRQAGARSVHVAVAAVADPRGDQFRSR